MSGFFGAALVDVESLLSSQHISQASSMLSGVIANCGGVDGVIAKCQQAGLGSQVSSWIGPGSNLPIVVADVERVFTPAQIDAFAAQHGVPAGMATRLLAHLLPHAVDQAASPAATASASAA